MSVTTDYKKLAESVIKEVVGTNYKQSYPWTHLQAGNYSENDWFNLWNSQAMKNSGFDYVLNNDGSVRSYTYIDDTGHLSGFTYDDIANSFNSNVGTATNASGNTFSFARPGNATVENNVVQTSGALKTFKNGAVQAANKVAHVAGTIGAGIFAASTGIQLGKMIDGAIYNIGNALNLNPPETLNPATWNSITMGDDSWQSRAFNTILGLDNDTGKATTYVDAEAFAYMAMWLKERGFFSAGEGYEPLTSYVPHNSNWNLRNPGDFGFPQYFASSGVVMRPDTRDRVGGRSWVDFSGAKAIYYYGIGSWKPGTPLYALAISDEPFSVTSSYFTNGGGPFTFTDNPNNTTIDGHTYYYKQIGIFANQTYIDYRDTFNANGVSNFSDPVKLFYNQTIPERSGMPEGVSDQTGATLPDTSSWNSPATTLVSIQNQYPDLWNNRIENDVLQPDGTTKTYTYIPTVLPEQGTDNTITTTNQQQNLNNPEVDPDSSTETLLQTIIEIITKPLQKPETMTQPKEEPITPIDNPTDLGDGSSPTIILPVGQASSLWKVYNPSQSQLDSFGSWLWSSDLVEQLKKLFNNPMESIIGIHKVYATPSIGGETTIKCGFIDSGVLSNWVNNQYTEIDCGTVHLSEYFGNVFDYSPYTTVELYLPFIGIVNLSVADVMRSDINVKYTVDVITGACLAQITVMRDNAGGVLYQYSGSAIVTYPLSSGSYVGALSGVLSVAMGIVAGGVGLSSIGTAAVGIGAGKIHSNVQKSGSFSGSAGAMGCKIPYLIISRPQTALATRFNKFQGFPANESRKVSEMYGYFKMSDVHLETVYRATDSELKELESLLLSGVIA